MSERDKIRTREKARLAHVTSVVEKAQREFRDDEFGLGIATLLGLVPWFISEHIEQEYGRGG